MLPDVVALKVAVGALVENALRRVESGLRWEDIVEDRPRGMEVDVMRRECVRRLSVGREAMKSGRATPEDACRLSVPF